jgi:SAM-dependent methyltransferase
LETARGFPRAPVEREAPEIMQKHKQPPRTSFKPLSSTDDVIRTYSSYRQAAIVISASRLGIFDMLAAKPRSARSLARSAGYDLRAAGIILDALAAMGLVVKRAGTYRCAAVARRCLVSGGPEYMGNMIDHHYNMFRDWVTLPEIIAGGGPAPARRRKRSKREHGEFILAMADTGSRSARMFVEAVDLSRFRRLLDVGGGPGTYAIAACRANPDLTAVVYDTPETAAIARAHIEASGLAGRIEAVGGDYRSKPLGGGFDIVLISNIIHSLGRRGIAALLRKAHNAMVDGGLVIVKDFYLAEDRTRPAESALFAVNMLVATKKGNCYTRSEIEAALSDAGFSVLPSKPVAYFSRLYRGRKGGK